ncbi:MAG: hypothetical protein ACRCWM_08050 [Sarcina sp.]
MDWLQVHKKKVLGNAINIKEKEKKEGRDNFKSLLNNSPTGIEVSYTKLGEFPDLETNEKVKVVINDKTDNDIKAYDHKKLMCEVDVPIEIGSYVFWQNFWWIVIFKEHKSLELNKRFTMAKCNRYINHRYKGQVYKIPAIVQSLTLYSDGLADITYTSSGDAKNRIQVGNNVVTKSFDIGTRIMVTNKTTFRITNLTDFEYNSTGMDSDGLISAMILQTVMVGEDDIENNIAYNKDEVVNNGSLIEGNNEIHLGETNDYKINYSGEIDFNLDFTYINIKIVNRDLNSCTVYHDLEMDDIGKTVMLIATDRVTHETIDMKNILVRGL